MNTRHGVYARAFQCTFLIFAVIVLLILLSRVFGGGQALQPDGQKRFSIPDAQKKRTAKRIASDYSLGNFMPSILMKENVDFLLTPALLVQEVLSDDVVITYPTE